MIELLREDGSLHYLISIATRGHSPYTERRFAEQLTPLHVQPSPSTISLLFLLLGFSSACAPSHQYLQGRGFYSDAYSEGDVDRAAQAGKLIEKGHFSVDASECGIYTPGLADSRIVLPALQGRMLHMGGNAVRHVKAAETADIMLLSVLTIPMACADWTISGDVVYVDTPPAVARPLVE